MPVSEVQSRGIHKYFRDYYHEKGAPFDIHPKVGTDLVQHGSPYQPTNCYAHYFGSFKRVVMG